MEKSRCTCSDPHRGANKDARAEIFSKVAQGIVEMNAWSLFSLTVHALGFLLLTRALPALPEQSGGAEEVEMGIDTTNVSSSANTRRSHSKRRKSSPDAYYKRSHAETDESEENSPSREEGSYVSVNSFQPISITAPDPVMYRFDIPQPSPATCGKRKVRNGHGTVWKMRTLIVALTFV